MTRHAIGLATLLAATTAAAAAGMAGCGRSGDDGAQAQAGEPDPAPAPASPTPAPADTRVLDLDERARDLATRFLIIDGHIDLPMRLDRARAPGGAPADDISRRTAGGDFDFERARAGGLDAPFMSIYVPVDYQDKGGARAYADKLIDLVESLERAHPDRFAIARGPDDVAAIARAGKVALPMGIENGAAIESDLKALEHFWKRGVRYITLTHAKDNLIGDSSYDERRTHGGLTPFGRKVVAEMNRLGIMVDISHVSDQTFEQVLAITAAPPIASHSSLRHFIPGFERNLTDDMVRRVAAAGGVVMINFGSTFVRADARARHELRKQDPATKLPPIRASLRDVADHIDRAVQLAGIDHVGFGSDFEGVGDSLPDGLRDVSHYPNLIAELLRRGYSEADIEKLCGANLLRVWRQVEAVAARLRTDGPG